MASTTDMRIYTVDGSTRLETYVAGVVTGENGMAALEALRAQAIAARTFVLRAMRDDATLGTWQKPISNTERFQVYSHSPTPRAILAAEDTAGMVCRYRGELIICNFVAGALWNMDGQPGADPTSTEKWVTYNEGKTGAAVKPTSLSNKSRPDNRGCMSQNGSDWLARQGRGYPEILRYFYGADLAIEPLGGAAPNPVPGLPGPSGPVPGNAPVAPATPPAPAADAAKNSSSPLPLLALAAFALLKKGGL